MARPEISGRAPAGVAPSRKRTPRYSRTAVFGVHYPRILRCPPHLPRALLQFEKARSEFSRDRRRRRHHHHHGIRSCLARPERTGCARVERKVDGCVGGVAPRRSQCQWKSDRVRRPEQTRRFVWVHQKRLPPPSKISRPPARLAFLILLIFSRLKRRATKSQFLQIVAKPERPLARKPEPKLTRVAFRVSRLMEFCTERELQNQTGHSVDDWPLVVLKELMDNALDACEEAEVAPVISIIVEPGSIIDPGQRAAASTPRPSSRSSTTRSGSPAARPTCRRPAARRAMR